MPSSGKTIIIGEGIASGSPFVLDQFLFVSNTTPPEASSYAGLIRGTNAIQAPGTQATAAKGNTIIGPNVNLLNVNQEEAVLIGSGIVAGQGGTPTVALVVIGQNFTTTGGVHFIGIGGDVADGGSSGTIKIGSGASMGGLHNDCTALGMGIVLGGASNGVVIGRSASTSASGSNACVIGNGAGGGTNVSVLGNGSAGATQNAVFMGPGISVTAGGTTNGIAVGCNITAVGVNNAITTGNGAEYIAGFITLGNNNLGAGGFSTVLLLGGAQLHTNATAVPAFTVRMKNAQGTDIAAGDLTVIGPRATGNAASGAIIFQTGVVGASGAALQAAASVARVTPAQKFEIMLDNGLAFVNQTDGAGAALGTLTNAPTAGDPAFWLRVIINGTNHFIPAWV